MYVYTLQLCLTHILIQYAIIENTKDLEMFYYLVNSNVSSATIKSIMKLVACIVIMLMVIT